MSDDHTEKHLIPFVDYMKRMERLSVDIRGFCFSLVPSAVELQSRRSSFIRTKRRIMTLWPEAEVYQYGSCSAGLYLPDSDIDIAVAGVDADLGHMYRLKDALGDVRDVRVVTGTKPIVKFVDVTGFAVDVCFNVEGARENADVLLDAKKRYCDFEMIVLLIKSFLRQRRLNSTFTGGLGSHAVCLMVLGSFQRSVMPADMSQPGLRFVEFLKFYGFTFDYSMVLSVRGTAGALFPRTCYPELYGAEGAGPSIAIEDPTCLRNVTSGCFKFGDVLDEFRRAYHVLCCVPDHQLPPPVKFDPRHGPALSPTETPPPSHPSSPRLSSSSPGRTVSDSTTTTLSAGTQGTLLCPTSPRTAHPRGASSPRYVRPQPLIINPPVDVEDSVESMPSTTPESEFPPSRGGCALPRAAAPPRWRSAPEFALPPHMAEAVAIAARRAATLPTPPPPASTTPDAPVPLQSVDRTGTPVLTPPDVPSLREFGRTTSSTSISSATTVSSAAHASVPPLHALVPQHASVHAPQQQHALVLPAAAVATPPMPPAVALAMMLPGLLGAHDKDPASLPALLMGPPPPFGVVESPSPVGHPRRHLLASSPADASATQPPRAPYQEVFAAQTDPSLRVASLSPGADALTDVVAQFFAAATVALAPNAPSLAFASPHRVEGVQPPSLVNLVGVPVGPPPVAGVPLLPPMQSLLDVSDETTRAQRHHSRRALSDGGHSEPSECSLSSSFSGRDLAPLLPHAAPRRLAPLVPEVQQPPPLPSAVSSPRSTPRYTPSVLYRLIAPATRVRVAKQPRPNLDRRRHLSNG